MRARGPRPARHFCPLQTRHENPPVHRTGRSTGSWRRNARSKWARVAVPSTGSCRLRCVCVCACVDARKRIYPVPLALAACHRRRGRTSHECASMSPSMHSAERRTFKAYKVAMLALLPGGKRGNYLGTPHKISSNIKTFGT